MPTGIYKRKSAVDRFWEKVDKSGDCWKWTASKANGYGIFRINNKKVYAHRFSWLIHNSPVPVGMYVCHRCDNPGCCNPGHLFLGTAKDNMQDAKKKGRLAIGEAHGRSKLTAKDVQEIRSLYRIRGEYSGKVLAKLFGVNKSAISKIVNNKKWRHV